MLSIVHEVTEEKGMAAIVLCGIMQTPVAVKELLNCNQVEEWFYPLEQKILPFLSLNRFLIDEDKGGHFFV